MDMLSVQGIYKHYDGEPLLEGLSLEVRLGEILCLLGPSGSGKSTLLRIIAGLEPSESGKILWNGEDVTHIPAYLRKFGLMFQDYALFPNRDVAENVAFGLEMQGLPREQIKVEVANALEKVNLRNYAKRSVGELSGGEQQRVALARSLAAHPRLLMLDEPLAALDRSLRLELQHELATLLHREGIPVIYVTHDQEEAVTIGDRLAILHQGKSVQVGTPSQVFAYPVSRWVAEFLGMENFIIGRVISYNPLTISTSAGNFILDRKDEKLEDGTEITLILSKNKASVTEPSRQSNTITGRVINSSFREDGFLVTLKTVNNYVLKFILDEPAVLEQSLTLFIPPNSIIPISQ